MSSPQERTRGETYASKRERILDEAVAQFYARGFTATTLDDIAAGLGVTKPFIYTYFRGKTELLAALCTPTIELSLAAVANAANGRGTPTERLSRAMLVAFLLVRFRPGRTEIEHSVKQRLFLTGGNHQVADA